VVVSTKAGEIFEGGRSRYDFSAAALRRSVAESARRLRVQALDLVYLHAHADDMTILNDTDAVETLQALKQEGAVRAIGFSGKSVDAARRALGWADVLMIEYHMDDHSHADVIAEARNADVGIVVKKGLASGRLDPARAATFVLNTPGVTSLVVGSLNLDHIRDNVHQAEAMAI
jgi:aryl-alcohol dehydrogenase-like predicted oxidoreductase